MLELILTACLLASPDTCKDVRLTIIEQRSVTPQQCFQYGQLELVKWIESNPTWKVTKWKCQVAKKEIDS